MNQYSKSSAGFTLIEVIIVVGILTIIGALTVVVNIDTYRNYVFRTERNLAISVLMRARSQAVSNVCLGSGCTDGKPHGVHFEVTSSGSTTCPISAFIIFQGANYTARDADVDEVIETSGNVWTNCNPVPPPPPDIVFAQLSGERIPPPPPTTTAVTLFDAQNHISVISINSEGQITWTN